MLGGTGRVARGVVLIAFLQAGEQWAYSSIAKGMSRGLKIASVVMFGSLA